MDDKKISLSIYGIVLSVRDTLSLPTHKTIATSAAFSAGLFVVSLVFDLLEFYVFISWQGALMCTLALVLLLWIERSENDALLRMYRSARVSTEKVVLRAKTAGSHINSKRSAYCSGGTKQAAGKGVQRGNKVKASRHNGVGNRNKRN